MVRIKGLVRIVVLVFFLSSCAPIATSPQLEVTPNAGLQTLTSLQETIGSDNPETLYPSTSSPIPEFSELGPYFVGKRAYTIIDQEHDNREIGLFVWYPVNSGYKITCLLNLT